MGNDAVIDTPHNRRKMLHYVIGMQRVVTSISSDDDPATLVEDANNDIEAIKLDWKITDAQIDRARKYMEGSK